MPLKKIFFFIPLLILLPGLGLSAYAQTGDDILKIVTSKLNTYTKDHVDEKAYLQFDKPYYAIGDTIYFKAYVTLGPQHKLSALSSILNVDLIEPDSKISRSMKLQIAAGVAAGDFVLADTLKGGNCRIRAYTNWMRNEGDDSFFEQAITVGTTQHVTVPESGTSSKKNVAKAAQTKVDVQFMPEGGSLVAGNYSKIAFKAISPGGDGTDVKGIVTDNNGNEICTFASTHLGMGSFNLVPEAGKSYKADITFADGTKSTIDLPKVTVTGYTININNANPDTIKLRISAGSSSSMDKLNLIAQAGGMVYYAAQNQSGNRFFSAIIPKNKFPSGIVLFTLFSPGGEPLNERLVFVNNNDQLKLDLKTEKQSYTTRQKVQIAINASDKENKPVTGSFSVAVTNETTVPVDTANENTILTNLLLTSDLKGIVEQPGYYFTSNNEKANADLDLLMLTQGYRHFEWKKVLSENQPAVTYQPEKTLQISGTVKKSGKPIANAKVTLFSKTGGAFMLDTLTDSNGKFAFKDLIFSDSTKFVVQSKVPKGQDAVTLEIDTVMPPHVIFRNISADNALKAAENIDMAAYLINQKRFYEEQQKYGINKREVLLKEVVIKDTKITPIPHSENLNGSGNADQLLTAKDLERFICAKISDCLSGVLTGVIFYHGVPLNLRNNKAKMAIVIDGNFVEPGDLDFLPMEDIEGIEVVIGPHYGAIYGSRMANGGLIVTTKRARKVNNYYRYAPGVVTYIPRGFYKAREFYSPQYDNPKTNQKIPDLRSTIYWKPDIITDKDGKATFSYFNADGKGTYRVVIEGIDADGNLGRLVYRYKVE